MIQQDKINSLVDLADSHVTQHTNDNTKSEWEVFTNGDERKIISFPSTYSEKEIFHIMDFAKEYELKALNVGINFQKNKQNQVLKDLIDQQKKIIEALKVDNDRLADALEREMFKHIVEI